jgi:TatD DNase family protein
MTTPDDDRLALVDTHAHLDEPALKGDLAGVVTRAQQAGVVQMIAIGTTAEDSRSVQALAEGRSGIYATVGIHPNHAAESRPGDWDRVVELARHPRVAALGETGLDRYRDNTPFADQQDYFDRHLALAHECGLPVVIHCRTCERDIIDQLGRLGRPVRGVLHSFTGTWDDAQAFLELGLHLSFAGMLTFTNKSLDPLRETAARVPIDRLLVETDSPYLSPHPHRGQSNEPARVALTAALLASLRGLSVAEFARRTTDNARRLFSLPADDLLAPSPP